MLLHTLQFWLRIVICHVIVIWLCNLEPLDFAFRKIKVKFAEKQNFSQSIFKIFQKMDYQETLQYIYNRLPLFQMVGSSAYKEGIDSMIAFDDYLGNPHKSFKTIHVGGTNGKGSVSHTLASVLQSAGYKVGLFTSPHLKDFRERIRVNGKMVSEEFVVDFVERHKAMFDVFYPSFFEVNVGMAFDYFRQEKVDVAIVEVGLGGRLDSTNIIKPEMCVITNISIDHVAILGNSRRKIAAEKAGIIKSGIPVVIGEADDEVKGVFIKRAEEVGAEIRFADRECRLATLGSVMRDNVPYQRLLIDWCRIETPLMGYYQRKNMKTAYLAVQTMRKVGFEISKKAMEEGFCKTVEQTGLLGRWQKLQDSPTVICDTGHNVGGIRYVMRQLTETKHDTLRIVFGMVNDKDITHVLELMPKSAVYYFTKASVARALPENELKERAERAGLEGRAYATVREALEAAVKESSADDLVYVGGSNFIVAEVV